jgi:non-ribosomal peptide synthetase-like protein
MRDIYLSQTIETLAARLVAADADESAVAPARMLPRHVPTRLQYYGCGALQFATGLCFGLAALWVLLCGFHWTYAAIEHTVELCLRVGAYILALLVAWCAIPVVAKWLLIGRWKPEAIPVWSLRYFRFWLVKSLVNTSPLALFGGGPLYNVYLRLLGARIGRNTTIRSSAPICTDMFSVGDETIIRNGTLMPGYTAEGNFIYTGPVHIGSNAFVGTASVVEIETRIGDNAQLGHSSCLQRGQAIPDGAHYHGTPAVETTADYCQLEGRRCTALRRWVYTVVPAIVGLVFAPVPILIIYHVFPYIYRLTGADKLDYSAPTSVIAYLAPSVLAMTLGLFAAFMALGILFVYATPRILNLFLEEGREYVLYGVHYLLQGLVAASSNSGAFNVLFGDSSWIVNYLRLIGFRMNSVTQTGANFGVDQVHDNPALCDIGSGTMVSDGISLANVEMSATSFRLGAVRIGARNYLGNNILFPPNGRVGDNVLLATKVMVPIDGPLRENVGLLGSPCFEIPRVVERDRGLPEPGSAAHGTLLRRKNLYNLRTIAAAVAGVLVMAFVTLLLGYVSILYYPIYGAASLIAFGVFMLPFGTAYWVMFERASLGFGGSLRPSVVSMYDDYFLFHERHWKFCANPLVKIYSGTPFKNLVSRLLGVKVGRMVFDDGAALYDKTLLEIGDYTNLNLGCVLQGHSLEEGIFKSDRITIGRECSIGCAAFVHYGVEMGDNVRLGANAFLMKGEVLPDDSVWVGNPARPVSARMARKAA